MLGGDRLDQLSNMGTARNRIGGMALNQLNRSDQGVTRRSRLCLQTNSALVIRVQMRGERGSCGASANEYSCAHHVTLSPNKLWRSSSIFHLWVGPYFNMIASLVEIQDSVMNSMLFRLLLCAGLSG
jgi:hypothetical protein